MSGFDQKGWDKERQPYYMGLADKYGLPKEELAKVICGEGKWGWGQSTSTNAKQLYGGKEDSWGPLQMYLGNGLGRTVRTQLGLTEDQFRSGAFEKEIADAGINEMARLWKIGLAKTDKSKAPKGVEYGKGKRCADYGTYTEHHWIGNERVSKCLISQCWHGYNKGGTSCGEPVDTKGPGGGVMNGHAPDIGINGETGNSGLAPTESTIMHDEMIMEDGWDGSALD